MVNDGLVLSLTTNNVIDDLKNLKEKFDFSNWDKNHELYIIKNEKVIRKFRMKTL